MSLCFQSLCFQSCLSVSLSSGGPHVTTHRPVQTCSLPQPHPPDLFKRVHWGIFSVVHLGTPPVPLPDLLKLAYSVTVSQTCSDHRPYIYWQASGSFSTEITKRILFHLKFLFNKVNWIEFVCWIPTLIKLVY